MKTVILACLIAAAAAYPHTMVNDIDWSNSNTVGVPKFTPTNVETMMPIGRNVVLQKSMMNVNIWVIVALGPMAGGREDSRCRDVSNTPISGCRFTTGGLRLMEGQYVMIPQNRVTRINFNQKWSNVACASNAPNADRCEYGVADADEIRFMVKGSFYGSNNAWQGNTNKPSMARASPFMSHEVYPSGDSYVLARDGSDMSFENNVFRVVKKGPYASQFNEGDLVWMPSICESNFRNQKWSATSSPDQEGGCIAYMFEGTWFLLAPEGAFVGTFKTGSWGNNRAYKNADRIQRPENWFSQR